jgi:hypothetical protein
MSATVTSFTALQESLKDASVQELLALIGAATAEAKKKAKGVKEAKVPKEKKEPKEKGPVPPQLRIPHAWVAETLRDANTNGWEPFEVTGKNPVTMPGSEIQDGQHVFPDTGKPMNHKLAMSLSKARWAPKTQTGTHQVQYQKFLTEFLAAEEEKAAMEVVKPVEAKAVAKEAKEAPKETPKETPQKKKEAAVPAAPKKAAKAAEWTCENDGNVHPWEFKGKKYARNYDNQVWFVDSSGEVCGWAGVFDGKKLDASAPEPSYMDEEDEE